MIDVLLLLAALCLYYTPIWSEAPATFDLGSLLYSGGRVDLHEHGMVDKVTGVRITF